MFILGIAMGIAITISLIAIMMEIMPPKPPDDIITGQNWFITGLGVVEITKVLNTGSFTEFGYGVNVQYVMTSGKYGHCTAKSLKEHGRVMPKALPSNRSSSKNDVKNAVSSRRVIPTSVSG